MPLFYHGTFGMTLAGAGFSSTFVIGSSCFLGMMAGGVASDRIATRRLDRRMLLQTAAYTIATPFLLIFFFSHSFALISVLLFIFAFMRAMGTANEHPVVCDVLPASQRSSAIGLMNCANSLARGGAILAATALTSFGYAFTIRKDLKRAGRLPTLQREART